MFFFLSKRRKYIQTAHVRKLNQLSVSWWEHSQELFYLLKPLTVNSNDVVLLVSWQKLTFGKDIGTSSISGYKKQLFSGWPCDLCQMILNCASSQTLLKDMNVQRKENLHFFFFQICLVKFSWCQHILHISTNGERRQDLTLVCAED